MAIVKFISDQNCHIFIDKENVGKVTADSLLKAVLEVGGYLIEVKDDEGRILKKYNLEIKSTDNQILQDISGASPSTDEVLNLLKNDPTVVFHCDRAKFCLEGKYGYVNKKFEVVIPAIYSIANDFVNNKAFVVRDFPDGRRTTMIDEDGNMFFNQWYDYIGESNDTILLGIDSRIIVYSKRKCNKITEYYNAGYDYRASLVPVYRIEYLDELYGFIDFDGNEVVPLIYDEVWNYQTTGYAKVKRFGMVNYVDFDGNLYERPNSDSEIISKEDSFIRGFGRLYGNGNMWNDIPTRIGKKWGLLSPYERYDGKERFLFECDKIIYYNYGCFVYRIQNICYLIQIDIPEQTYSYEADEIIPIILEKGDYGEDVINLIIKKNRKYGIIDIDGEIILPIKYDKIETTHGVIECYPGEVGIINLNNLLSVVRMKDGKILFPFEYEDIKLTDVTKNRYWLQKSWYIVKKNEKYGCIKPNGEEVLPIEFDKISHLYHEDGNSYWHELYIKKGNKYGCYTIIHKNMLAGYGGDESTDFREFKYNPFDFLR